MLVKTDLKQKSTHSIRLYVDRKKKQTNFHMASFFGLVNFEILYFKYYSKMVQIYKELLFLITHFPSTKRLFQCLEYLTLEIKINSSSCSSTLAFQHRITVHAMLTLVLQTWKLNFYVALNVNVLGPTDSISII